MSRTLYERVIVDRMGSVLRGREGRRRSARDIDLDVNRARHQAPRRTDGASTRPLRLY